MNLPADDLTLRLVALATAAIRQPASFYLDSDTGPVLTFDPPLTAQEQAVYTGLVDVARSAVSLTPAHHYPTGQAAGLESQLPQLVRTDVLDVARRRIEPQPARPIGIGDPQGPLYVEDVRMRIGDGHQGLRQPAAAGVHGI